MGATLRTMRCESCEKREATVHLTEILQDDEKRSVHLCDACARDQHGSMELLGLLPGAFPSAPKPGGKEDPTTQTCDACGMRYQDFRARGRLGCADCYDSFKRALDPLLEKIHGKSQHVGKAPDASSAVDRTRERRLIDLRRQLQTAIREERYEEAAGLRDTLRSIEESDTEDADADL